MKINIIEPYSIYCLLSQVLSGTYICNKISKPIRFSQPTIRIQSPTPARTPSGEGVDQYTTEVGSVYDWSHISIRLMYLQYGSNPVSSFSLTLLTEILIRFFRNDEYRASAIQPTFKFHAKHRLISYAAFFIQTKNLK